ncbi:DNA helicase [Elysia marginata]|uniref:DNA helicase n=1 Tax=Elysia marginata TaxID=1093978 RepID=A0AAV4J8T1_9GAST|nr:DNA helicase [Elysia marginata]
MVKYMRLGHHKVEQIRFMGTFEGMNKHLLSETEPEKDMGVIMDIKLKYKEHTAHATEKSNRTHGVIKRFFDHLTDNTFAQILKTLVRPYGYSVWQSSLEALQQEV